MSISISINNEQTELAESTSLQSLITEKLNSNKDTPFAVALNGEFVPKSQYSETLLNNGDQLDIVSPVGGG